MLDGRCARGENMIEDFIDRLAKCVHFPNVENQYSDSFSNNLITRNNLKIYLEKMLKLQPKVVLIGEAPGFNGCRWSGIPFTAEKNQKIEYKQDYLFGLNNGYKIRDINNPQSEASATIVWEYLKQRNLYPLIWNAFPFHPHLENDTESNRKPSKSELEYGKNVLEELIGIYHIEKLIAVGNTAHQTLTKIGIKCSKVRHPANGGKEKFVSGMNNYL